MVALDPKRTLTQNEELFLAYLETTTTIKEASELTGIPVKRGYEYTRRLKDVIQARARDALTVATLRAVNVVTGLLEADETTVKGELKLKASESILDRSGITKHTNVDVQVETTNGIFMIPSKKPVPPEYTEEEEIEEGSQD